MLSRWNFDSNNRAYVLRYINNQVTWFVSGNGLDNTNVSAAAAIDTPVFIEVYHDAEADQIGIAVNGGTFTTASHSAGIFNSSAALIIGSFGDSGFASPMQGWVDEVGIWNRMLTADERAALYNSGNGIAYPG
jgi:hypothetical protein